MQRVDVGVQADACIEQGVGLHLPGRFGRGVEPAHLGGGQHARDLGDEALFVHLLAVQVQAELVQAGVTQALAHDLQRGHLLADEKHALAAAQALGDDVGDGLALAGTRRPLQHEADAGRGGGDGLLLAGVGIQNLEAIVRAQAPVQLAGGDEIGRLRRVRASPPSARRIGCAAISSAWRARS